MADPVAVCGAVNPRREVIAPCGPRRELTPDIAAAARVALPVPDATDLPAWRPVAMAALIAVPVKPGQRKRP